MNVSNLAPIVLRMTVGRTACLPKVFTEVHPKFRYPPSVSRNGTMVFESDLKKAFLFELSQIYDLGREFSDKGLFSGLSPKDRTSWSDKIYEEISKATKAFVREFPHDQVERIEYLYTFERDQIVGGPDLVIFLRGKEAVLLDVEVFCQSTGRSKESRLVRARTGLHIALARETHKVKKVALITPWCSSKKKLFIYDVSTWKEAPLWELVEEATNKIQAGESLRLGWKGIYSSFPNIGHHQRKSSLDALLEEDPKTCRPFQVFLLGNRGYAGEEVSLQALGEAYRSRFKKYRAYVHAPYSLSLSKKRVSTKEESPTIYEASIAYMEAATKMGFSGVVFHVDKCPGGKRSYRYIRKNVELLLPHIDPRCPLYLETPCGDGSGFLSTPEDFSELVEEFPPETIGVCLDTCHVHGAGYRPLKYLSLMGATSQRIGLIHLNGAWKERGCRADGHSPWNETQNISEKDLMGILEFSETNGISCIIE